MIRRVWEDISSGKPAEERTGEWNTAPSVTVRITSAKYATLQNESQNSHP